MPFGRFNLIDDVVLFERNPVDPNEYAVTNLNGQLILTGVNGAGRWRPQESPFSIYDPASAEENNAFVSDIAWSPDGQYLAFIVDGDKEPNDGVWFFAPGSWPPLQLLVDCHKPDHPGCGIVRSPSGPDLWESLGLEWSPTSDALLVSTFLPSANRNGLTILPVTRNERVRDERPPVLRYEYGSWENNGSRILVSGRAEDDNVYIAWVNRDGSFSELVFAARDAGLWVQNAVQRLDGSIVTLGSPGGSNSAMRIYNQFGQPLTDSIGDGPPQRVEWSPDRSAVLLIVNGRVYLANVNGSVTEITQQVGGARAINWVSGSLPLVDSPAQPPATAPVQPDSPFTSGAQVRVLAAAGLNIRAQPDPNAAVLGLAPPDSLVILLSTDAVRAGNVVWWNIQDENGIAGWVAGEIDGIAMIGLP